MQTTTTPAPNLAARLLRQASCLLAALFLLLSSGAALAQANQFVPHDDANQVPQNTTKSGNVLLNDDNPQNLPNTAFTVTLVTLPTHGTVTLNANGSYSYTPTTGYVGPDTFTYKICLTANPTNCSGTATVFLNVYDASIVCTLGTGPNLILNPSFARGNIGFASSYTFVPTPTSVPDLYAEGTYAITGNATNYHTGFFMTGRNGATDNFMTVNGAASLGIVYSQTVTVQPNTYYFISAYGASANSISPAQLGLVVDGKSTSVVTTLPSTANQYVQFSDVYFSGPGAAGGFPVTFEIRDINKAAGGNDFGIDDLYFGSCSTLLQAETKTTTAVPNAPVPAAIQPLSATITTGGSTGIQVASFTVQTLPATGILYYNGALVTVGQVIPVSGPGNLTSGGALTYQPATGCPTGNVTFTYTATNNAGSPSNNTATYTIPVQAYTVVPGTIAADQTICAGSTPASLTSSADASSGLGAGTYDYQWESSPDNITWTPVAGATSTTYAPGALSVTTYYRRRANSGACATDVSNAVTITVQPAITAGTIAADQTICAGTSPTALTSTAASGGTGTYSYQWESSPDNITWTPVAGATNATFTPPALTVTTYYRLRITSGVCASVTTTVVTITVQTAVLPGVIAADQTICAGTVPAALTSVPLVGTGPFIYQWESSPDNITWTAIPGATGTTYAPPALTVTTYYRLRVTLGAVACGNAASNVVTITVQPAALTPGSIGSDQTLCIGSTPAALTEVTAATAGGTVTYQWESSPDNLTWTAIAGATGTTYAPAALSATTYYRRRVTLGTCGTALSNVATITVQPAVVPGSIAADQTTCAGTAPAPLTSAAGASGGSGPYAYQWESSPDNLTWTTIAGATGATYAPPALTTTTYYRRTVAAGVCAPAVSNVITITVQPAITPGSIGSDQTICAGSTPAPLTSTSGASGGTGTYTYQWESSLNTTTWTSIAGATGAIYTPGALSVTTYYRRKLTSGTCGTDVTNVVTVTVQPLVVPGTIAASQTICVGATPAPLTSATAASGGSGTYAYQWESSPDNITWTPVAGAIGATYAPGALAATTYFRRTVAAGVCAPAISNVVTVQTQALLTPTIQLATPPAQCPGTVFTFVPTAANAGPAATYQWLVNGTQVATTPTYASSTLANGDQVQVVLTPAAGVCATGAATATVTVSLTSVAAPALTIAAQTALPVCAGTPITLALGSVANAGASPQYQWQVNGVDVPGATATTFTSATLLDGQAVTLTLRTTTVCGAVTVVSNAVLAGVTPLVTVSAGPDLEITEGESVTLQGATTGSNPTWTPTQTLTFSGNDVLHPQAAPLATTTYTLSAGAGACTGQSSVTVTVTPRLRIPSAFTPNGDGTDDTWRITNLDAYPLSRVIVFNRWGSKLFESTNYGPSNEWDGTYKGQPAPLGTYYYLITLSNGKHFTGPLTIIY